MKDELKYFTAVMIFAILIMPCLADIVIPVQVIDFNKDAPKLIFYKNSTRTYSLQLQNYGVVFNGTNTNPYLYIAPSKTSTNPVAGSCSWQVMTSCVFTATFTSNNFSDCGTWIYGAGLSNSNGRLTFRQGSVEILPDPWR